MLESDEMPTEHRPALQDETQSDASTLQVPAVQTSENATPSPQTLPAMGIEDLLAIRIASDPQISPDGQWIAFSLQQCHAESNTTTSAIWLVHSNPAKTAAPRQLTSGSGYDSTPRWSPDGQTLAFLSSRGGSPQLYLLPLNGGEAHQFSTLPQGITEYSWRPDGSAILAHSAWKPEDETSTNPASPPAWERYTHLENQWDGLGNKQERHQQLWLLALDGTTTRLTSEPVDLEQSCWSPDGIEIVFCANRRSDPDLSVSRALWVLTLATGQLRCLTPQDGLAQMPSWSPDGQWIAYLFTPDQTEAGNYAPWIVNVQGHSAPQEAVTGASAFTCQTWVIDELRSEWLQHPQWYPNSQALLVTVQEKGQVHLCRLDRAQDQIIHLTNQNGRYVAPNLSRDGQSIAVVRGDWFTPGDIWSMNSEGKQPRKLTGVNDDLLRHRQLTRPKRINWQAEDGLTIEGWLYLPPLAADSKAPLILVPHGGPSLAWGDSYVHEFQVLAGRGYAVLAPNPRGSAGYGDDFGRKVIGDWGGADFHDLLSGLDHVIATEAIDEQRLGIEGISYGGYLTNWAISQTQRFKAAVSRNGISSISTAALLSDQTVWFGLSMPDVAQQQQRSALTFVEHISTPLLLLHAGNDLRCPFSESMQLFVALRKRKQPVELVNYHHVSHLMDWPGVGSPQQRADRIRRTIAWFEKYL